MTTLAQLRQWLEEQLENFSQVNFDSVEDSQKASMALRKIGNWIELSVKNSGKEISELDGINVDKIFADVPLDLNDDFEINDNTDFNSLVDLGRDIWKYTIKLDLASALVCDAASFAEQNNITNEIKVAIREKEDEFTNNKDYLRKEIRDAKNLLERDNIQDSLSSNEKTQQKKMVKAIREHQDFIDEQLDDFKANDLDKTIQLKLEKLKTTGRALERADSEQDKLKRLQDDIALIKQGVEKNESELLNKNNELKELTEKRDKQLKANFVTIANHNNTIQKLQSLRTEQIKKLSELANQTKNTQAEINLTTHEIKTKEQELTKISLELAKIQGNLMGLHRSKADLAIKKLEMTIELRRLREAKQEDEVKKLIERIDEIVKNQNEVEQKRNSLIGLLEENEKDSKNLDLDLQKLTETLQKSRVSLNELDEISKEEWLELKKIDDHINQTNTDLLKKNNEIQEINNQCDAKQNELIDKIKELNQISARNQTALNNYINEEKHIKPTIEKSLEIATKAYAQAQSELIDAQQELLVKYQEANDKINLKPLEKAVHAYENFALRGMTPNELRKELNKRIEAWINGVTIGNDAEINTRIKNTLQQVKAYPTPQHIASLLGTLKTYRRLKNETVNDLIDILEVLETRKFEIFLGNKAKFIPYTPGMSEAEIANAMRHAASNNPDANAPVTPTSTPTTTTTASTTTTTAPSSPLLTATTAPVTTASTTTAPVTTAPTTTAPTPTSQTLHLTTETNTFLTEKLNEGYFTFVSNSVRRVKANAADSDKFVSYTAHQEKDKLHIQSYDLPSFQGQNDTVVTQYTDKMGREIVIRASELDEAFDLIFAATTGYTDTHKTIDIPIAANYAMVVALYHVIHAYKHTGLSVGFLPNNAKVLPPQESLLSFFTNDANEPFEKTANYIKNKVSFAPDKMYAARNHIVNTVQNINAMPKIGS